MTFFPVASWNVNVTGMLPPSLVKSGSTPNTTNLNTASFRETRLRGGGKILETDLVTSLFGKVTGLYSYELCEFQDIILFLTMYFTDDLRSASM